MRSSGLHGKDGLTLRIQTPQEHAQCRNDVSLTGNTPCEGGLDRSARRAQQISTFSSAGGSSGSGSYRTNPPINAHSYEWHTPVRHDHFTGTS